MSAPGRTDSQSSDGAGYTYDSAGNRTAKTNSMIPGKTTTACSAQDISEQKQT